MVEIARLLAASPTARVTRFMRAALHAPNLQIQEIARNYLAENVSPMPPVPRAFPRTAEEKITVAKKLANSSDSKNTPKLVKLLSDLDPNVRVAAAKGLGRLNRGPDDSRDERERNVNESLPPLMKALSDSSPEVRAAAAAA